MLKERIGMCIFCIGVCMADSRWLIVPITLVALGAWLMRGLITQKGHNND